jgi:hypothetical protein
MLLMSGTHPQRRRRSKPRVLCAFIGAKRRALTDAGAEGISAADAVGLCFQQVPLQQPEVPRQQPGHARSSLSCLIPLWFPHRNFRFLYSTHSGVTCHQFIRCVAPCSSAHTHEDTGRRPQTQ